MLATSQLLSEVRASVEELYSSKVQLQIEQQTNSSAKQEFLQQREKVRNYLNILEKQDLQKSVAQMQPLESQLKQATKDLDRELQSVNNMVNIISSINAVTGVLAKIVMIV